jgi:endogenous inhibitor of DNA gyrase (YacG/DUF329 family)
MIPPTKTVPCEKCGNPKATVKVTAEDCEAPKTFSFTRECPVCGKSIEGGITAAKMHELTGLPLTGWAS